MKLRSACLQSVVIALAVAGILAAPLGAQAVPAAAAPATGAVQPGLAQPTGVAPPASDLVPVIQMFTGPGEWDIVGGSGGSFGPGPTLLTGGGTGFPSAFSGAGASLLPNANSQVPQFVNNNPQSPPAARQGASPGTTAAAAASMPARGPAPAAASAPQGARLGAVPAGRMQRYPYGYPRPVRRVPPPRTPDFFMFLFSNTFGKPMRISILVIPLFATLLGLASCAAPGATDGPAASEVVTLTAELVPDKDPDSLCLNIQATITNNSREPIIYTNLGFGAILFVGSEVRILVPPAPPAPMTLTTQPGGNYKQEFQLFPNYLRKEKNGLKPGRYRMRIRYRQPGAPILPPLTRERDPNVIRNGIVLSLDSASFDVVIKPDPLWGD